MTAPLPYLKVWMTGLPPHPVPQGLDDCPPPLTQGLDEYHPYLKVWVSSLFTTRSGVIIQPLKKLRGGGVRGGGGGAGIQTLSGRSAP